MVRKKSIRTKGKIQLSKFFQKLSKGDKVAVTIEKSRKFSFPRRLQGRTGIVEEKKGKVYIIKIKDQEKEKKFLIEPIHLKKLK